MFNRKENEIYLSGKNLTEIPTNLPSTVQVLWLNNNNISKISNIDHLFRLTDLHLNNNQISSLAGLEKHKNLQVLTVANNNLKDLANISSLYSLSRLTELDLSGNSIADDASYRSVVLMSFKGLEILDNHVVDTNEKKAYCDLSSIKPLPQTSHIAFGNALPKDIRPPPSTLPINTTRTLIGTKVLPIVTPILKEKEDILVSLSSTTKRQLKKNEGGSDTVLLTSQLIKTSNANKHYTSTQTALELQQYAQHVQSDMREREKERIEQELEAERQALKSPPLPDRIPLPRALQSTQELGGIRREDFLIVMKKDDVPMERKDYFKSSRFVGHGKSEVIPGGRVTKENTAETPIDYIKTTV